jgi:hypothetical protein
LTWVWGKRQNFQFFAEILASENPPSAEADQSLLMPQRISAPSRRSKQEILTNKQRFSHSLSVCNLKDNDTIFFRKTLNYALFLCCDRTSFDKRSNNCSKQDEKSTRFIHALVSEVQAA